jgi:serine protease Do
MLAFAVAAARPARAAQPLVAVPPSPPPDLSASGPQERIARALEYTVTLEGNGVYGSGVLLAPEAGLIVTNVHVVEEMSPPQVTFHDGTRATARVVELDRALDLALLVVPAQPKRRAPAWGDVTALRPGDEVYAVGCPRHLSFTVSRGIVSYVGRDMEGTRYLQTDLPINDGNSGGPVINARGELVGLMSFVLKRSQGLSFALPVNYAADRFAARLGHYAQTAGYLDRFRRWLGR